MEYTVEQVVANFNAMKERIKPAVLREVPDNGNLITAYIQRNKLAPTAENFHKAVKSLMKFLNWLVKPARLLAEEQNDRPITIESAQKQNARFAEKVKASEKDDTAAKEKEQLIKESKQLIASFTPVRNTPRGSVINYAAQSEAQIKWTKSLEKASKGSVELMRQFNRSLSAEVKAKYEALEKAGERL
jgi:hypothetical protein